MARRLTIRTKLAAALAVPLVALATFAGFQVREAHDRADTVKREAELITNTNGPASVLNALERERAYETLRLIGAQDRVDLHPGSTDETTYPTATNTAINTLRAQLRHLSGDVADDYSGSLGRVYSQLPALRNNVQRHAAKTATAAGATQARATLDDYGQLVDVLLDTDQRAATTIDDAQVRNGAELANAIARQNDVEQRLALTSVLASSAHSSALNAEALRLSGEQQAGNARLLGLAGGRNSVRVRADLTGKPRLATLALLDKAASDPAHAQVGPLLTTLTGPSALTIAQTITTGQVKARANDLISAAHDDQRNWELVTLGAVVLAILVLWLANRWITRPLRALTDQATDMANRRLPEAVQQILDTPADEDVRVPDIEPVHVGAGGEVGELEVVLNRVQDRALQLAVQQASLRRNIADAYVNLGRRNQNLLARQLEFISQLESEESDPETLEHLFRLDHLATRMRRNAESLLVLAGHAPPRTWSAPVPIADVVRGALGEVEGYQRVRLRHLDEARVDGAAAADVSHVIAELVENSLTFSPPNSDVEVYGRLDQYGYMLTVVDNGIGMPPEELERANDLISAGDALTLAPSRFLGHYVVAQLARRHEMAVHLTASPAGGITAMVLLPAVLMGLQPEAPEPEAPVGPVESADTPADVAVASAPADALPALPRRGAAVEDDSDGAPPAVFAALAALAPPTEPAPPVEVAAPVESAPAVEVAVPVEPAPPVEALPPVVVAPPVASWDLPAAPEPEPAPEPAPPAPVAETVAEAVADTAPEPPATPEPGPDAAAIRRRMSMGSFADLRADAVVVPPRPPEPAAGPAPVPPAAAPPAPHPELAGAVPTDARSSFAGIAEAVDDVVHPHEPDAAAAAAAVVAAAGPLTEDFLPQKLPKRGRRASRRQAPWSREKPARAQQPAPAAPTMPPPMTAPPVDATSVTPPVADATGPIHFGPGPRLDAPAAPGSAPAPNGNGNGTAEPSAAAGDGDDRFAFFAAFRAAAEQAREEAGIDERRTGH